MADLAPKAAPNAPNGARGLRDGRQWDLVAVYWDIIHSSKVWGAMESCFAP